MSGFVKIYGQRLLTSSVWQESKETRLVWVTLLAMADADGIVDCWLPGVAKAAGVTVQEAEAAFDVLSAPDPYSRTVAHDGCRIAQVVSDGQRRIRILNHGRYRDYRSSKQVKAAERQRRHYRKKASVDVRPNAPNAPEAEAEAEANSEAERTNGPADTPAGSFMVWTKLVRAAQGGVEPPGLYAGRRKFETEALVAKAGHEGFRGQAEGFAKWVAARHAAGKERMRNPWTVFRDDFGTWIGRVDADASRHQATGRVLDDERKSREERGREALRELEREKERLRRVPSQTGDVDVAEILRRAK